MEITGPTLIVVSGPPGSGKTTLARRLARRIGCPAICRDEIKEGMVLASPRFEAPGFEASGFEASGFEASGFEASATDDELNLRTLPTFFSVLRLLLEAGVTTVAEAAFQDRIWRPQLEPLMQLADVRVVQCVVDERVGHERIRLRETTEPTRKAHDEDQAHRLLRPGFTRIALDVPTIDVDTTDGYAPGIEEVARFATIRTR